MNTSKSIDRAIIEEIAQDAKRARQWSYSFIISGIALQLLHFLSLPIRGVQAMVITAGIILVASGLLFYLGSRSVPTTRPEIIKRLQTTMLEKNPKRRLWAAQRLVGYAKDANFSKKEIVGLAKHAGKIVSTYAEYTNYKQFIAADHIILLREIAISVPMDKHVRSDFVRVIKPLQKIKGFQDEVYEVLSDAIAYHPSKLPVQAYSDLMKEKK
ncbi:MAG: hypothetical protein ACXAD7_00205 [Candidatus Kariarchaeaceae archaeon]